MVLTERRFAGRPLGELANDVGARGVFLRKLSRAGNELPFTRSIPMQRGDVLTLVGAKTNVARAAEQLGFAEWPTPTTDIAMAAKPDTMAR